jgi:hypothetical protein
MFNLFMSWAAFGTVWNQWCCCIGAIKLLILFPSLHRTIILLNWLYRFVRFFLKNLCITIVLTDPFSSIAAHLWIYGTWKTGLWMIVRSTLKHFQRLKKFSTTLAPDLGTLTLFRMDHRIKTFCLHSCYTGGYQTPLIQRIFSVLQDKSICIIHIQDSG